MSDRYISDDQVTINTQGLRTVLREDEPQWMLRWSYKGEFGVHRYLDQAARDAMYNALRRALAEKEQQRQPGGYRKIDAIKLVRETGNGQGLNIGLNASKAIVEALEPIMRPAEEKGIRLTPPGDGCTLQTLHSRAAFAHLPRAHNGGQGDAV